MNWRVALAGGILTVWLVLLFTAGSTPDERWKFDAMTPFAFAAITFIFAEPVFRDRRHRKRRRRRDDGDDDAYEER